MKISIASALHGQTGNTTVALMVAHALALTQHQNICITHANFGNPVLSNYLGVESVDDVTRSLSHVTKMLKNNMLRAEEVPDYALKVFDGLDLYSSSKLSIDMAELLAFYDFLLTKMTIYNHIVIDVDAGITSDVSKLAMSISDILIIPVTHNQTVLDESRRFKEEVGKILQKMRRRRELKVFFLLNHYHPELSTYKTVASKLGVRPQKLLTLHYNTGLIKSCNNGKISDALAGALAGQGNMLNLRSDMKNLCQTLIGKDAIQNFGKEGNKK